MSLTRQPEGWRSTFIRRNHATRPRVGQVLTFHPTPWRAVQHAAWTVLDQDREVQDYGGSPFVIVPQ